MAVFCSVSLKMDATSPLRLSAAPPHPGQRLMHQDLLCQTVAPLQPRKTHLTPAQHAFERVTTQELFHHLCIAHFRHWFRFIHPRARYTCGSFSPHTRLARNPKYLTILKNFSGMCCFSLATSSRCVSVSVAVSPVLWSR